MKPQTKTAQESRWGWVRAIVCLGGLCLASLLLFASPGRAAVVTDRPLLFSFDGSDSSAGRFQKPYKIAIDNSTGAVYVSEDNNAGGSVVSRFNADGTAANFSATGASSLTEVSGSPFTNGLAIAVDNSGGPNDGELFVSQFSDTRVMAFGSCGSLLWQIPHASIPVDNIGDVAFDASGHPWLVNFGGTESSPQVFRYENTTRPNCSPGIAPDQDDSFLLKPQPSGGVIDFDANGNAYLSRSGEIQKFAGANLESAPSTLDLSGAHDVYADQLSPGGHVFTSHKSSFNEYDSSGALVGTFGTSAVDAGQGIAYNPTLDRVYLADEGQHDVEVFGPPVTGTVPDPAIEASGEVGIGRATFHGTINPQSVANAYYFEWSADFGESSGLQNVSRSPLQSLPEDGVVHPVSFKTTELHGNANYRVRLVAVNTVNGLRSASAFDEFKTSKAATLPTVTIDNPSAITTTSAKVTGTINPHEDAVSWKVQKSPDPACASGFSDEATQTLFGGETSTPAPVEFELKGLLPTEHYCARINATNSAGTTTTVTKEFATLAVPPDEAGAAFAAPRLDTSARLNAFVNPQGHADLTYHFEWSEDGVNWTALPDEVSGEDARKQIVIGEELGGLKPDTTYHYRLGKLENEAGPAVSLGQERIFKTRAAAEVQPPSSCPNEDVRNAQHTASYLGRCRGIELVSKPDKGNQHARAEVLTRTSPLRADGNAAVWNVLGGAPGGNSGAGATFLSRRTGPSEAAPNGWESRSLVPPGAEQIGEAEAGGYFPYTMTPDFSSFVFNVGKTAFLEGHAIAQVDADGTQTPLKDYANEINPLDAPDLSNDGRHVFLIDQDSSHQLQDLGSGTPETVSIMPDGQPNECGLDPSQRNDSFIGGGGPNAGEAAARLWRPGYHMVAVTNGARVYFQVNPNADERGAGVTCETALYGIYERNRETGQTFLVDPGEGESPNFIRATPDGREAFFLTSSKLDPADANSDPDVYRWSEASGESTCLTCVVPDADISTQFRRGVLVSDDLSHVYFESTKRLVPDLGGAGDHNVYVLSGGKISFVTDPPGGSLGSLKEALLSGDGNVLVFGALAGPSMTTDPIAPSCEDALGHAQACHELYRYENHDDSLECLSCAHNGPTEFSFGSPTGTGVNDFAMSADGSTVAFATVQTLTQQDVNGFVDIYEWRDGVRSLLTNGVDTFQTGIVAAPQVMGVSADGSNVLFSVVDPGLTGFEQDGLAGLYDARIDGGFTPPTPPVHCAEDSCQGSLVPAPTMVQPASADFAGRGNLGKEGGARPRCAKGRARRHGRCVRRHREKTHRHHNHRRSK